MHKQKISDIVFRRICKTIRSHEMLQHGDSVLIGVSGGPDSVALLHLLTRFQKELPIRLGVAHINHCLRGKDSDNDANFVESLAIRLKMSYYGKKADVLAYAKDHKISTEEAGRLVRYAFFNETAKHYRFNKIAVGHHAGDNAESILMYLFRGSGLSGISGIPPVRDSIIRPLIDIERAEILDYVTENDLHYVSDASNNNSEFSRNRIRNRIIPEIESALNPKIIQTLNRFSEIVRDENAWIEGVMEPIFQQTVLDRTNNLISIDISMIEPLHIAAKRRIIRKSISLIKNDLRRITFAHIDSAVNLIRSKMAEKMLNFPDGIVIRKQRNILYISKEGKRSNRSDDRKRIPSFHYTLSEPGSLYISEIEAVFHLYPIDRCSTGQIEHSDQTLAFFDANKVSFPMMLRNIESGDRFTPLGMKGTQKVCRYLMNKKASDRPQVPILMSRDRIVWVVGHQISDDVRVSNETRNLLKGAFVSMRRKKDIEYYEFKT